MCTHSDKLIDKTMRFWEQYSSTPLSDKDAIEIIDNTIALFELLEELEQKYAKAETDI